jgi:putative SOS response-associated peptidase YedK
MCGRYSTYLPAEALRRIFRTVNSLPDFEPSWNVTRSQMAPVVRRRPETDERRLDLLEWGLLRWWQRSSGSRRPIIVRAETMLTPGKLRGTFLRRRCSVVGRLQRLEATDRADQLLQLGSVQRLGDHAALAVCSFWLACA